jgi:hypothetical protein
MAIENGLISHTKHSYQNDSKYQQKDVASLADVHEHGWYKPCKVEVYDWLLADIRRMFFHVYLICPVGIIFVG